LLKGGGSGAWGRGNCTSQQTGKERKHEINLKKVHAKEIGKVQYGEGGGWGVGGGGGESRNRVLLEGGARDLKELGSCLKGMDVFDEGKRNMKRKRRRVGPEWGGGRCYPFEVGLGVVPSPVGEVGGHNDFARWRKVCDGSVFRGGKGKAFKDRNSNGRGIRPPLGNTM